MNRIIYLCLHDECKECDSKYTFALGGTGGLAGIYPDDYVFSCDGRVVCPYGLSGIFGGVVPFFFSFPLFNR